MANTPKLSSHKLSFLFFVIVIELVLGLVQPTRAQDNARTYAGTLTDGATFVIHAPADWNRTLLLYSHGFVIPGTPNPADDFSSSLAGSYLLQHGYALAGSSYAKTGWAVEDALRDQIDVLNRFDVLIGKPSRTIAWGESLGGLVTAGLIQKHPERFSAALPMCGVLAGGVGVWNKGLDESFAFTTLVAPSAGLQMVHISDPTCATSPLTPGNCKNLSLAQSLIAQAQATPEGSARIALTSALAELPEGFNIDRFAVLQQEHFLFNFALRADLEARAGGNPSWNVGVDYATQLKRTGHYAEISAIYSKAGLSLENDLNTLNEAPRIAPDPPAVAYLSRNIVFNGEIEVPVLTLHTIGDELIEVEEERAYSDVAQRSQESNKLRQTFVNRAFHCNFTDAEIIAALDALIDRLDNGHWPDLNPEFLNSAAAALGPALNFATPAFTEFPGPFLRPFYGGPDPQTK
jgi:hypothetical protein